MSMKKMTMSTRVEKGLIKSQWPILIFGGKNMKDFAVRIWDSKNKEMVIVTELTLDTVYKLRIGENKECPMLASPYYDIKGDRLFENDVVVWPYYLETAADELEYETVTLDDDYGWVLRGEIGKNYSSPKMCDCLVRNDWRSHSTLAHHNAINYVKIGNIYSLSDTISKAKIEYQEKKEAEKREKELQCLLKLKAKYEVKG